MKVKKGKDEKIFLGIAYVLTVLFAVICLLPFYLILVGSFTKESTILTEGYSFFLTARNFSLEAYKIQEPGYYSTGLRHNHICYRSGNNYCSWIVCDDGICTGET